MGPYFNIRKYYCDHCVKPLDAYKKYSSFFFPKVYLSISTRFAKWAPSWALPEQGIIKLEGKMRCGPPQLNFKDFITVDVLAPPENPCHCKAQGTARDMTCRLRSSRFIQPACILIDIEQGTVPRKLEARTSAF